MSAFPRICLQAGCGRRFKPSFAEQRYCATHQRGRRRGSGWGWREIRAAILARDLGRCHYCGELANTVDHLVPVSAGGTDAPTNLVAACARCNGRKGDR
jgi:5-methylcytosine-specific restriction endonuclease McrA